MRILIVVKIKQDRKLLADAVRWPQPDGGAVPVAVVVVALVAAVLYFFLVTKKRMDSGVGAAGADAVAKASGAAIVSEQGQVSALVDESSKMNAGPEEALVLVLPEKPRFGFARALDLGKDFAQSLSRKDWVRAGHLVLAGQGEGLALEEVRKVFESMSALGFQVASNEAVEVMGQVDQFTRVVIPFTGPEGEVLRMQLDVMPDAKMGWKVAKIRLPELMMKAVAQMETPPPVGEVKEAAAGVGPGAAADAGGKMAAEALGQGGKTEAAELQMKAAGESLLGKLFLADEGADVLTHVNDFVRHLLNHDFAAAREYLDESRVPAQRLAGLCIVFEEGQYVLMPNKPLMVTATVADASWVVAKVQSEKLAQQTEFGIELQRQAEDMPWQVVGLNLSDILGSFAKSAAQLGVPYTPIVKNPKGGESLALYFEYDDAGLHPRAQKQLQIVADLLMSDATKRLRIAGHTDALGGDRYNFKLSRERAASVKAELVARGVPPEQVEITGLGKEQPLGPNQKSDGSDDPEGRSRNRRAEIYLDF